MVFAEDNTPVAAWPTHTDSGKQMANAKLLAQAPALLAALKEAMPIIHSHHEVTRRGDETSCERSCAVRDFMERTQATIEAAEK
jgi:hypothetical protein